MAASECDFSPGDPPGSFRTSTCQVLLPAALVRSFAWFLLMVLVFGNIVRLFSLGYPHAHNANVEVLPISLVKQEFGSPRLLRNLPHHLCVQPSSGDLLQTGHCANKLMWHKEI